MQISLEGRVALVTGGSAGLGLAMATRFAASGAAVGIVARRADKLAEAADQIGGRCATAICDVSDPSAVIAAHEALTTELGPIDILVNNAGVSASGPFLTLDDAAWQRDLDVKLFGAIRFTRLVLPGMQQRRWGRIINVLNIGAKAPPAAGYPTTVSRAAGMALTKALAGEVAGDNVLVNALCTGVLVTDQWPALFERRGQPGETYDDFLARTGRGVPLGRMGDPEEFANLACFLASDAASYLTGYAINVDGGASRVV